MLLLCFKLCKSKEFSRIFVATPTPFVMLLHSSFALPLYSGFLFNFSAHFFFSTGNGNAFLLLQLLRQTSLCFLRFYWVSIKITFYIISALSFVWFYLQIFKCLQFSHNRRYLCHLNCMYPVGSLTNSMQYHVKF